MNLPITYLFVPGNRPERFDKALATNAGAIILDLEDAVVPTAKGIARDAIANWFDTSSDKADRVLVRINDTGSEFFNNDLALIHATGIRQVMLPKTENREQIQHVISNVPEGVQVLPLVETALGIRNIDEIAMSGSVTRLAFGTLDYAVDLDLSGDPAGLAYPSAQMAIASRCAGLPSPVAGVTPSIKDSEQIRADYNQARAFGFGAKMCIHPVQVDIIHDACRPSSEDEAWARRVLAAGESSEGAVSVDGKMIDRPVLLKAQALIARCKVNNTGNR